jgi:hypothetical protein
MEPMLRHLVLIVTARGVPLVKCWSMTILLLVLAVATSSCAVRRSHDYTFGVTGIITTQDGSSIEGAEVVLDVYGPVYAGVAPVHSERLRTDSTGGFVFMHISHERGVKYMLTVQKAVFEVQTITGHAPPDEHHTIRLKKAGNLSNALN